MLRGAAFYAVFYPSMAVFGLLGFPFALIWRGAARHVAKSFFAWTFLLLRVFGGVRVAVRGPAPRGAVLVAAKHQSMLDVFMLYHALPEAFFVMKRELTRAPVFGWYALRVGAVPVDRGGGAAALEAMVAALSRVAADGGQMVIYPQGTRTPPGVSTAERPYKVGVHAVYAASGRPCAPVATNSGSCWPRGLALRPGVAVLEFLPEIAPGLDRGAFMARLEAAIEPASAALASAGGRR